MAFKFAAICGSRSRKSAVSQPAITVSATAAMPPSFTALMRFSQLVGSG